MISRVTFAYRAPPVVTSDDFAAVQRALHVWEVDTVVLPDQPELPEYDKVASVPDMAALITGATGIRPTHTARAWVWSGVNRATPPVVPTAPQFSFCTSGTDGTGSAAVDDAVTCMLASSPA